MKKKKTKCTYRLRNWKQYNAALVQRGSLALWVSDDVMMAWRNTAKTGKPGPPRTYSDTAVLCLATLTEVYHLPLRATQGLMLSLMKLLGLDLPVLILQPVEPARRSLGSHLAAPQKQRSLAQGR